MGPPNSRTFAVRLPIQPAKLSVGGFELGHEIAKQLTPGEAAWVFHSALKSYYQIDGKETALEFRKQLVNMLVPEIVTERLMEE